jgi:hypothetical protein
VLPDVLFPIIFLSFRTGAHTLPKYPNELRNTKKLDLLCVYSVRRALVAVVVCFKRQLTGVSVSVVLKRARERERERKRGREREGERERKERERERERERGER